MKNIKKYDVYFYKFGSHTYIYIYIQYDKHILHRDQTNSILTRFKLESSN